MCNDISNRVSNTMGFLVPILIFDLIGSVPLIICNITFIIMHHCVSPLVHTPNSSPSMWRFATMTCVRLNCHRERPQAILLTRIIFIVSFFILRFICFVIGASCSARFQSVCTAYTVIAAFALVASIIVIIVEFIHFSRLWTYNPTETANADRNQIHIMTSETKISKTHRRHLRFIHYSLLNDQQAEGFRRSRCKNGTDCQSRSLHHHLFYHSLDSERNIASELSNDNFKKSFIAFHQTTKQDAYIIAQKGFPYGSNTGVHKDYLHLDRKIFFTPCCNETSTKSEAIVCVRLNLGRVFSVDNDKSLNLDSHFAFGDGQYDTIYVKSNGHLLLRMPAQIEQWIIAIDKSIPVNDALSGSLYRGCF